MSLSIDSLPTSEIADVCLIVEGTYPYVAGGVASWAHDLIKKQSHLKFAIVAILAPESTPKLRFALPENVISLKNIALQELPKGKRVLPCEKELMELLEPELLAFQQDAKFENLCRIIDIIGPHRANLGRRVLLESTETWNLIQRMYSKTIRGVSFVDYFWSWRSMFGGLYSLLLPSIPPARLYHSLCTGFAGLFAARASYETGSPCLLTEHGIYTNERRIELGVADWVREVVPHDLTTEAHHLELRDLWIKTFCSYSQICYQASKKIVTLFAENQRIQEIEGAENHKLMVIPNGIDFERFSAISHAPSTDRPTIALIGRVVPIKGVKTFIMACRAIQKVIPNLRALVLGPYEEDPDYYQECLTLVRHLELESTLEFLGQVKLDQYLGQLDLIVLTSVSEAQPLVILEAGAAGIPAVATNVGACKDLILGEEGETPAIGPGGGIAPVSDSAGIAREIIALLTDPEFKKACGQRLKQRVSRFYTSDRQHHSYRALYQSLLGPSIVPTLLSRISEDKSWPA